MRLDGSCHCGAVRFEAEGDAANVSICHCADCQSLTGTAFRVSLEVRDADFRLRSGQPRIYVKTAESGASREQAFCGDCGSPLYTTSPGEGPKAIGLRVGALSQRAELRPTRQVWHRSALPWTSQRFSELPAAETET